MHNLLIWEGPHWRAAGAFRGRNKGLTSTLRAFSAQEGPRMEATHEAIPTRGFGWGVGRWGGREHEGELRVFRRPPLVPPKKQNLSIQPKKHRWRSWRSRWESSRTSHLGLGTDLNYRGWQLSSTRRSRRPGKCWTSVLSQTKASRMRVWLVGVDNSSGGGKFTQG